MAGSAVTCLKRMRLPLLAASIAMACILLLDAFVLEPPREGSKRAEEVTEMSQQEEKEAQVKEDKKDTKTLLFDQALWDNVQEGDDWDAIFDSGAWSSLLNEGFVGANVKDEPPLPRFKKPAGNQAIVPKDGAMKAKAAAAKPAEKVVISIGLSGTAADVVTGKAKKKLKKAKKKNNALPEKILPMPPVETTTFEWFDASYKKSATYGKAKEFVEDEPLFKSCAKTLVAARAWGETFVALNPFRYLGRSKNPCWYPDNGGKFTCIPYFFLAGVAGPASEDLMKKIMIHPNVLGQTQQHSWWDIGRHAGKTWDSYTAEFQEQTDQILLDINDRKSSDKIYGDSTNTYWAAPTGWERLSGNENCDEPRVILGSHIRRLRVKGLVLIILPHPTRRLLAEYRYQAKGKPNMNTFNNEVNEAIRVYKECFSKYSMRQCAYNKTLADSVKISLHEGMYSIYMEDWIRIFPPEQLMMLRFEDYVNNTVGTLNKIYDFLEIPEIEPADLAIAADPAAEDFRTLVAAHNPSGYLSDTVKQLNEFYTPFLKRMGEIMNDPIKFTWKDT